MPSRTYVGPLRRGSVNLPDRSVPFTRDEPAEFTADEAALLDPSEWNTPKKADEAKEKKP